MLITYNYTKKDRYRNTHESKQIQKDTKKLWISREK